MTCQTELMRARQECMSAMNGVSEITMALIGEPDVFSGHLRAAADQFERVSNRLRAIADRAENDK